MEHRRSRFGGGSGTPRGANVGGHLCQSARALLRVYRLHAPARLFEADDGLLEGYQRRDFRVPPRFHGKLPFFAQQPVAEQQVIHLARLAQSVEVDFLQQ